MNGTYEIAIETLNKEIESLQNKKQETFATADFGIGNFKIRKTSDIRFEHANVDDVYFYLPIDYRAKDSEFPYKDIDKLSWSSWSFSSATEENLTKAKNYLSAELEKIEIISNKSYIPVAKEYHAWYKENIYPINIKISDIQDTREKLESQKRSEQNDALLAEAKKFFIEKSNTDLVLHDAYYYTKNKAAFYIHIGEIKKDTLTITVDYKNKRYDNNQMLDLYKHITKKVFTMKTNYEKNYDDESRYTYYRYDNITNIERDKINLEVITKEEYVYIRYN